MIPCVDLPEDGVSQNDGGTIQLHISSVFIWVMNEQFNIQQLT
jgi:hypothetical protein